MVYATQLISGGHLNPIVTLCLLFSKKIKVVDSIFYIIAQFLGAIFGSFLLRVSIPFHLVNYSGANLIGDGGKKKIEFFFFFFVINFFFFFNLFANIV